MEVPLPPPGGGAPQAFRVLVQASGSAGRISVLLQSKDSNARYMLSDAVTALDLGANEFVGRVRARGGCRGAAASAREANVGRGVRPPDASLSRRTTTRARTSSRA